MVGSETRVCQNCKREFRIAPEDFGFYERIQVPPPTWCPECRNLRRMAAREARTLYRGACRLCGRDMISIHDPQGPFIVYCRECWYSDKWDPLVYGRTYDFNRPFFAQYRELMEAVPRPALTGFNLVNSEYSSACNSCKNCYMVFLSYYTEDAQNSWGLLLSRNVYDSFVADNSDHAYETLHVNRMYRTSFAYFSDECLDSAFLFDCIGCSDCFGCVNLRKKKYCLFNEQLSPQEYSDRIKYWDLGSYRKLEEAKQRFREVYLSLPHRYAHILNSREVTGDIIRDAKDCQACFSVLDGVQSCKYLYFAGLNLKDSYDVSGSGNLSSLLYEVTHTARAQRCLFGIAARDSRNSLYCTWVRNCTDLFGCIGLQHKKNCILNKQYPEAEYRKLVAAIREQMDALPYRDQKGREYRFGEFFPPELSAYPYNQSFAFDWYPKTKAEVLAEGWLWKDPYARDYQITLPAGNLPDHIREAADSLLDEVIGCAHADLGEKARGNEQCTAAFRLTREELEFHRRMNLALPRLCPNCRYVQRLGWRNKFDTFHRRCACAGVPGASGRTPRYINQKVHFHEKDPCPIEFETTFSPDKPEIIYCEQCFRSEFL